MWGLKRRKRSIRPGFIDNKRAAFYSTAVRRYAWEDYERVSVRNLAREAAVSVSTFYDRFGNLKAFWYAVAGAQFQAATRAMSRELAPGTWSDASPEKIVRQIVEHVVRGMDGTSIGITRMAVKLNMNAPLAAKPFHDYRTAITDRAVNLLEDKIKVADPEKAVRQSMRAVLAIAADTSWNHNGPLLSWERESLIDEVKGLMCRSLGLDNTKGRGRRSGFEKDDAEKAIVASHQAALQEELPIYKVDLKEFEKAVDASRKPGNKLKGKGINPDDAWILQTRDAKYREIIKLNTKPKRKYRML